MLSVLRRKLHSARIRWHRAYFLGLTWHGGAYCPIFERKHLLTGLLRGAGLATVADLAVIGTDFVQVLNHDENHDRLPATPDEFFNGLAHGRYFVKPVEGEHGRDAACLQKSETGFELNGQPVEISELLARYARCKSNLLLQRWQAQHAGLARFSDNTLNTLRLLTVRGKTGTAKVFNAVLRIGRSGAWLDNFHAGGIALQVDLQSGATVAPAVRLDRAETYSKHPDSGIDLDAQPVPDFHAACTLVERAHDLFPEIQTVGWDVAIAPDGPRIVEGNLNWDAEIHALGSPDFRARLASALRAV